MHIVLIGPKIFPPFDSAYSSIGFNLLKALLKISESLSASLALISSFNWNRYAKLYHQPLTSLFDNNEFSDIVKEHTRMNLFVRHTWSHKDNTSLDCLLLKLLRRIRNSEDNRIIVQSLIPLRISILYGKLSVGNRRTKFAYYLFHAPVPGSDLLGMKL